MTKGMVWGKKKAWIIILIVALVLIVAIVATILIMHFLRISGENTGGFPSMHTAALEEINERAAEMSVDDAKKLYEQTIAEAGTDVGRAEARVEYGRYLLNNNEMESFVEQFEMVDNELLDDGYDILYYAALRKYYSLLGDEAASEEYNEKIRLVVENSDYAAGG